MRSDKLRLSPVCFSLQVKEPLGVHSKNNYETPTNVANKHLYKKKSHDKLGDFFYNFFYKEI